MTRYIVYEQVCIWILIIGVTCEIIVFLWRHSLCLKNDFSGISKNTFFAEHLVATSSGERKRFRIKKWLLFKVGFVLALSQKRLSKNQLDF